MSKRLSMGDAFSPIAARFAALAKTHAGVTALRNGVPGEAGVAYDFATFWRRIERVTGHLQDTWALQAGDPMAWLG